MVYMNMKYQTKPNPFSCCPIPYYSATVFHYVYLTHGYDQSITSYPVGHDNDLLTVGFVSVLAHCGLVTPYGDTEPGQHWIR